MADKVTYPRVLTKSWFLLRQRAEVSATAKLTPEFVASVAGTKPKSASDNVLNGMRRMGLIDDDGALTDRGKKWRLESTYSEACDEILSEVYPDELRSLTDENGDPDLRHLTNWMQLQGFGLRNASDLAKTYALVARKEIEKVDAPSARQTNGGTAQPKKVAAQKASPIPPAAERTKDAESPRSGGPAKPNLHIDLQVHISADADAEQIDKIFESMAKHLYNNNQ